MLQQQEKQTVDKNFLQIMGENIGYNHEKNSIHILTKQERNYYWSPIISQLKPDHES